MPVCINRLGSLYTIFFTERDEVKNLEDALSSNTENFATYFNTMLDNGIVIPPSQFEAHFISLALTDEDIAKTLEVTEKAFKNITNKI